MVTLRPALPALITACALVALAPQPCPAGEPGGREAAPPPYRIARGDRISILVLGEPELKLAATRVEPTGTVNLVLVRAVMLAGLTVPEAEEAVSRAYREGRFLRSPRITVTVDEPAPRTVIISGKVNAQGRQEIPPGSVLTVKDLIFRAGGFTDTARGSAVKVTRTLPDGTRRHFVLDVESGIRGRSNRGANDAAFALEPDDVVYVPERLL